MEVLISIGIVAVGLLSVASLLPVGSIQTQKAALEEHKSTLGLNAFRDFKIRGFGRPEWWVTAGGAAYDPANEPPLAIDPLMVAAGGNNVTLFPRLSGGGPTMNRLSVRAATTGSGPTYAHNSALAEGIAMASDDQEVDQPGDVRLPATAKFQLNASNAAVKRLFEGKYTWLATITPIEHDPAHAVAVAQRQFMLSVVVFNRRTLALGTDTSLVAEAQVEANYAIGNTGISGGDFTLNGTAAQLALAKPGQWLMLCRNEPWTDYDPMGMPVAGTPRPVFKWYRIVAAEPAGGTPRNVTLTGPDWPTVGGNPQTYACLFEGAVAVYQRPIRLEGTGVWSN